MNIYIYSMVGNIVLINLVASKNYQNSKKKFTN